MKHPEVTTSSPERTALPFETTYDQLLEKLIAGNVPLEAYGQGGAKTIHHFLSEINEGEAVVTIGKNNAVFREVSVLGVDILCKHSNGVYILKEDRQEFKDQDGRVDTSRPVKRRELDSSIGEKLKPNESPEDAITRALEEELGVKELSNVYKIGYEEKTSMSETYPGIESTYKLHKFVTVISEDEFKPEGYVEDQHDKMNYYVWEQLPVIVE